MAGNANENAWKDGLKRELPQYFSEVRVLDVGAADINGTNKSWFDNCEYIGLDVLPYKNVDVVAVAHEYDAPNESFDVVCSTSELEHDKYWKKTLKKMVELVKPGGLVWFAACHASGEHGTKANNPRDSLTSGTFGEVEKAWNDYYGNISIEDVKSVLDLDKVFERYGIRYSDEDELLIYFWGVKK